MKKVTTMNAIPSRKLQKLLLKILVGDIRFMFPQYRPDDF